MTGLGWWLWLIAVAFVAAAVAGEVARVRDARVVELLRLSAPLPEEREDLADDVTEILFRRPEPWEVRLLDATADVTRPCVPRDELAYHRPGPGMVSAASLMARLVRERGDAAPLGQRMVDAVQLVAA